MLCLLQESSCKVENQYDDSNIPKVIKDIDEDTRNSWNKQG